MILRPRSFVSRNDIPLYMNIWLGAVHILRQPPEGGGGVSQKLTIADEGGRGGKPKADNC